MVIAVCATANAQATDAVVTPLSEESPRLLRLLPSAESLSGWRRTDLRLFGPDTLWEHINGGAEVYLTYGVRETLAAEYAPAGRDAQVAVDVYLMPDAVHAFGIFSEERNGHGTPVRLGGGGYTDGSALNFWSGPYYVKITAFESTADASAAVGRMAARIAERIGPAEDLPQLGWFSAGWRTPESLRFIAGAVIGQRDLANAFEATYRVDATKTCKVLLLMSDTTQAAVAAVAKYRQYLEANGGRPSDLSGIGEAAFTASDRFQGAVTVVRSASRIVIVVGDAPAGRAESLIGELLERSKAASR